ncbi:MAG: hypothetical protein ATN34_04015 [Epulopiscium sp. Nele67-Bin002]|nr:MAG: hypothetical protein ATN34_04015 [Epulopiscium sp. Nele67-Bin002]
MREIIISDIEANQRLDKFMIRYLRNCPVSLLYKYFRTNKIKYNGKKPKGNEKIQQGDTIKVFLLDEILIDLAGDTSIANVEVKFQVVYEDSNILLVNKPLGLLTQKATKDDNSLAEQVLSYLGESVNGFRPSPCNRLDRNTSGIVVVGKNLVATTALSNMLKKQCITKNYLAIVKGVIKKPITLYAYHRKQHGKNEVIILDYEQNGAKPIETRVMPIQQKGDLTLIEVQLVTGKTHQIRAHLKQIGHPIIGDYKYGETAINDYFKQNYNLSSQFLYAYKIKFEVCEAPLTYLEHKVFTANAPSLFAKVLEGEGFLASS